MNRFNVKRHQVEQEGSKQCAVVYLDDNQVFVSYDTVVGFTCSGHWYFTEEKHSVTTSCQVSAFDASRTYLPEDVFSSALGAICNAIAQAIITSHEEHKEVLIKQQTDFNFHYLRGMEENVVSLHLVALAKQLEEQQGKATVNRITREAKQALISQLFDFNDFDTMKEKQYNGFKAKFNKAVKADKS